MPKGNVYIVVLSCIALATMLPSFLWPDQNYRFAMSVGIWPALLAEWSFLLPNALWRVASGGMT